jgi:hypothetical protein
VAPKLGSHTHTVHIEWLDRSFSAYCALQQPPTCAITEPSKATREKNAKAQVAAAAAVTAAKAKVAAAKITAATTATTAAAQALTHAIGIETAATATAAKAAKVAADGEASAAKANIHGLTRDTAFDVSISVRVATAPCSHINFLPHKSDMRDRILVRRAHLSSSSSLTPSLSLLRTDVSLAGQVPAECLGSQQKRFRHINSRRFLRCASCVWFASLDSVRQVYHRDRRHPLDKWLPRSV